MPSFLTHTTMEAPPAGLYYPRKADMTKCLGIRTDSEHADTRWTPAVYEVYQCKKSPMSGSTLCETCQGRLSRQDANPKIGWNGGSGWLGMFVAEGLYTPKPYVHTPGTPWFTKAKWTGVLKVKEKIMKPAKKALEAEVADLKDALETSMDEKEAILAEMEEMEAENADLKDALEILKAEIKALKDLTASALA